MKIYYFLLFTIYRFYKDKMGENEMLMFYTSAVSSVLVGFNLLAIYSLFNYYGLVRPIPNKFVLLSGGLFLWVFNYFLFVKKGNFLKRGFNKSFWGGFSVIVYIILTAVFAIAVANLNRNKLEKLQSAKPDYFKQIEKNDNKKANSLEGRVRSWFSDNF